MFSVAVLVGVLVAYSAEHRLDCYAFNIWVSLFSIILVSQGWLIAANIFTSREAKRLYGILGVGSVIGAAFGGTFTASVVRMVGTTNLILACAAMVVLSYIPFWFLVRDQRAALTGAKAARGRAGIQLRRDSGQSAESPASAGDHGDYDCDLHYRCDGGVPVQRHGQTGLSEQERPYRFLGNFYGFWLNLITFVCQFFLTGFVVSRFGVGGTLQIMPA